MLDGEKVPIWKVATRSGRRICLESCNRNRDARQPHFQTSQLLPDLCNVINRTSIATLLSQTRAKHQGVTGRSFSSQNSVILGQRINHFVIAIHIRDSSFLTGTIQCSLFNRWSWLSRYWS